MLSSVVPQLTLATLFTFFISHNSHTAWENASFIGLFFLIFHLLILAACRSEIFGLGKSMSIPIGA